MAPCIKQDSGAKFPYSTAGERRLNQILNKARFRMIKSIVNRILHKVAMIIPGGYKVRPFLHKLRGVQLGDNVWISQYVYLDELHPEAITIGENSSIGLRTSIITHFYWGPRKATGGAGPVHIGKDVFIGPHCVILPHVTIGDGSVVSAGTVVSQSVPPHTVWGEVKAGPVATATVPLTRDTSYELFQRGLRPIKKQQKHESKSND